VVSAETRTAAIQRLRAALRHYAVLGIRSNIPFLLRLIDLPAFTAGDLHTGFIDEHREALLIDEAPGITALAAAALAGALVQRAEAHAAVVPDPWSQTTGWGR